MAENTGKTKGSMTTAVTLFCGDELKQALTTLGEELRFVLITSEANVVGLDAEGADQAIETEVEGLKVLIVPSEHEKCDRCWHQREDVGSHEAHPKLCGRCIENVDGDGESRKFA